MPFTRPFRSAHRDPGAGAVPGAHPGALAAWALALALLTGCGAGGDGAASEGAASEGAASEGAASENADAAVAASLADDAAKASYSLGYRFAENVQRQFPEDIDSEAFVRGVRDQLTGQAAVVDDAEAERVLTAMMEARQAAAASQALENLEEGLVFLEENAKREEVTALDSGLQYEVLEKGEGAKPGPTDTVTTHYEGRLIDGTVFDSSYQRGEPASFPLNRVIAGWTEGLQLMSPGAKYRLYVPAELAYGDRAAGSIPANSTLIFDVELLEVGGGGGAASDDGASDGADENAQ